MRSDISFLPQGKQDELAFVVRTIRNGFSFATSRRNQPHLKTAKLLKIILFGSYARGDWVEDPTGRYFSDYDLLIVVNHEALTDWDEYWDKIDRRLIAANSAGRDLRTPHSLIVHSLDDVDEQLRLGRYFFMDILRDGILLSDDGNVAFAEPQPLSPAQALDETRRYFDSWFTTASEFVDNYQFNLDQGRHNNAAFQLHQAAERAYHCLLLVRTLYSPKTHKLGKLREAAEDLDKRFRDVWSTALKSERRCFALLVDAYVKARYSPEYRITKDQLDWLGARVAMLLDLVEQASRDRLEVLEQAA